MEDIKPTFLGEVWPITTIKYKDELGSHFHQHFAELGSHFHQHFAGPYQPKRPIRCPACLDRLAAQWKELTSR
jgi:hypothetical protein